MDTFPITQPHSIAMHDTYSIKIYTIENENPENVDLVLINNVANVSISISIP